MERTKLCIPKTAIPVIQTITKVTGEVDESHLLLRDRCVTDADGLVSGDADVVAESVVIAEVDIVNRFEGR